MARSKRTQTTISAEQLWEILVPTVYPDGRPIRLRFHRVWDEKVRQIAGGLTILTVTKGVWTSPDGEILRERMIPVRIRCCEADMRRIMQMTLDYYAQKAVLAYRISDCSFILMREE